MRSAATPRERALFWTFAVAAIAALLVALVARVADRFLSAFESETANYAIVRVLAPEDDAALARAQALLEDAPGVANAERMSRARATQMLREAGADATLEDLPQLRLIELRLDRGADGESVQADLSDRLAAAGFSADVLRPPAGRAEVVLRLAPLLVQSSAIGFALVLALIAGLAARGLASRRADLIQVMADLGATRGQTARRVGDEAGAIGFGAGVLAAFLVGVTALGAMLLAIPGATVASIPSLIAPLDLAPFALAPFLCAFVAGSGARAATDSLYAEAARLA
jgi:cell division protein FtsX